MEISGRVLRLGLGQLCCIDGLQAPGTFYIGSADSLRSMGNPKAERHVFANETRL